MSALFIFAVVLGPMTALLLWVIICELRGVPAFPDGPAPEPGTLDTVGRWMLGIACAALAALAFVAGGAVAVLTVATVIAALATLISLAWTLGQNAARFVRHRGATRTSAPGPPTLAPFRQRFARNFRRTIIQLPLFFVANG